MCRVHSECASAPGNALSMSLGSDSSGTHLTTHAVCSSQLAIAQMVFEGITLPSHQSTVRTCCLQFMDALRTGADDEEIATRRHALLTKAAPELNPGEGWRACSRDICVHTFMYQISAQIPIWHVCVVAAAAAAAAAAAPAAVLLLHAVRWHHPELLLTSWQG
jgi:hypothetical protein